MNRQSLLMNMFQAMLDSLGPSRWWPGETPFEVAIGAILTQNASWTNVEQAIANLKAAGVFAPKAMFDLPEARLAELIRPSGYFRLKAGRLKNLLGFLKTECGFDITALAGRDLSAMREKFLSVRGIGPETADSILLYALDYPTFVVDAYTRRLLSRHGLVPEEAGYDEMREFFMDVLDPDPRLYNEYHALIVRTGKSWCKKAAGRCGECPLARFVP
ncbi:MAG: endonuclease III domain-containing protein [Desulfovibrionaceae bacterium]|nr:endonuclease III domain-containing protein [Desulfovibrionaceae bacterium]